MGSTCVLFSSVFDTYIPGVAFKSYFLRLLNITRSLNARACLSSAMNHQIAQTQANYEKCLFKEALKTGFFELQLVSVPGSTRTAGGVGGGGGG